MSDCHLLRRTRYSFNQMAAQQDDEMAPDSEMAIIIKNLNFSYVDRDVSP